MLRQQVGCSGRNGHEVGLRLGRTALDTLAQPIAKSGYGQYLLAILREPYFAAKSE